jgi:hypothetical protein
MTNHPVPLRNQARPPALKPAPETTQEALARLLSTGTEIRRCDGATPGIADEYDTPDQLANELGISVRTLGRWHRLRIGPPRVKVGRLILYPKAGKREWLATHASGSHHAHKRMGRR